MARPTYMSPDEVKRAITELYGRDQGGQRRLADDIGKHELTVSRYCTDAAPVGKTEAILIKLLVDRKRTRNFTTSTEEMELM